MILGIGEPLVGRLLLVESLGARTREVRFERDPHCAVCSDRRVIRDALLIEEEEERDEDEVEPHALDEVLDDAVLLDVREPHEVIVSAVEGAVHVPASELESRLHELDTARRYVVACRVGAKSLWAARRLRDAGFTRVRHLRGGLLAYAAVREDFTFF